MTHNPASEVAPECRLIMDERPPLGKSVWLLTLFGTGYVGPYDSRDPSVVAWSPLPKLSPAQKARLKQHGVEL